MATIPSQSLTIDSLIGKPLYWLLELNITGTTIRLSTNQLEAPTGDDEINETYQAGLDFNGSVDDVLSVLGDEPDEKSVSINAHLIEAGVKISSLIEAGYNLGAITGRLMLWAYDTSEYIVVIDGIAEDPTFDTDDDPLVFTLRESAADDTARGRWVSSQLQARWL